MRARSTSMTVGLALGVTAAASIASAAGASVSFLRHQQSLSDMACRNTLSVSLAFIAA
jgi:hypothetical protein